MSKLFETSPNDSPGDGTIHPMALEELREWQKVADRWSVYRDTESVGVGRACMRCGMCNQCIWFEADQAGHLFQYTEQMIQALIVGHIRRSHSDAH